MLNKYPNIEKAIINDINTDLTDCYKSIKFNVEELIELLATWQEEFNIVYFDDEKKKEYYYEKRSLFNTRKSNQTTQSALFIFLNKTCFNGLYRVNSKGGYNVPVGRSASLPAICREDNLRSVSNILQKVEILNGDYSETLQFANENTFFYFDPPYKPLSKTSSFNAYAKEEFDDEQQIRLKEFCDTLDQNGHQWVLSNSDVKGADPTNNFFDDLYHNFEINRVFARRSINSKAEKRGKLTELLIKN